jgi:hypothetical protein
MLCSEATIFILFSTKAPDKEALERITTKPALSKSRLAKRRDIRFEQPSKSRSQDAGKEGLVAHLHILKGCLAKTVPAYQVTHACTSCFRFDRSGRLPLSGLWPTLSSVSCVRLP